MASDNSATRKYAEALRREREFIVATSGKDDRRVGEVDAELRRVEGDGKQGRRR